jgi:hypothetical protein
VPAVVLGLGAVALVGSLLALAVALAGLPGGDARAEVRPAPASGTGPEAGPRPAEATASPAEAPLRISVPQPVIPAPRPRGTPPVRSSSDPVASVATSRARRARAAASPSPTPSAPRPVGASLVAATGFGGAVVKASCPDGLRSTRPLAAGGTVAVPSGCRARVTCLGAQVVVDGPGRHAVTGCTIDDPTPHLAR